MFTADEIAAYYNAHKADFKLDRTIVKGRIVRFGEGYRQAAKLKTLMGARSEAQQQDFRDICEKNDFTVDDFRDHWIDFPEFLSYLPTLRSQSYDSVLATAAVQEMRDSHAHYYFQIDAVLREGEPIPLERLRENDSPHPVQPAQGRDHPRARGGALRPGRGDGRGEDFRRRETEERRIKIKR